MAQYHVQDLRTVALVGHEVAGKTSICDALLYKAKANDRRGCVDEGTSVSDYDDEEKRTKYSIDSSVLHFDHKGKRVYLIDTPGKPEFAGQAFGALDAVDLAVIVISAASGVQVNTRRMYAEAARHEVARVIVINKIDTDNVHFDALLKTIRESLGKNCVLFNAPDAVGPAFKSVVDELHGGTKPTGTPVDLSQERALLVDAIVESDEALMEKFLSTGEVTDEELEKALPHAIVSGAVVPILCTSAKKDKDIGIAELLDFIVDDAPSPLEGRARKAKVGSNGQAKEIDVKPDEKGEVVAQVFKTHNDTFVGHLCYLRIYSGTLNSETPLYIPRVGKSARGSGLMLVQGKTTKPVHHAIPGDIVAVAKVDDLHIGDTVNVHAGAPVLPKPHFPTPMFGLAIEPKARGDEQKISGSLQKIADEDPTFKVSRDPQTKELVITGMSQLHLDIVQKRLKARFGLEVVVHEPKIAYRETITADAEAAYKHKKQSGGRGQFAEVHMRVYPLPREIKSSEQFFAEFANKSRFEKIRLDHCHYDPEFNFGFIDHIVGGTIPNQFIPAVEKGCKELLVRGALAGYRMEDVAVEVHFGKSHDVDSSEAAFKIAGRLAFKNAFLQARPVLLEPIVNLEITVPSKYTGAILGDLNTKRARIENQDSLPGDLAVIMGKAPLAEVTRYAAQLGSITQGTGSYTMEFSHYDVVPGNVQQQIVSKAKLAKDEEEE